MDLPLRSMVLAAAALAMASCELASDPTGSRRAEGQFRVVARDMYRSLLQPSCEPRRGFSREAMLSDERQAVSAFERYLIGRPGSEHIKIAKADAELTLSCWADSGDPGFALMHVTLTKEDVRSSLAQMRELAPRLRSLRLTSVSASEGAEFRLRARNLIESIRPMCRLVFGVSNDEVIAPARERVTRFGRGLAGSDLAVQFDVAESDVEFEQSRTQVECAAPEVVELDIARRNALTRVEHQIAELEAIVRR